MNTDYRSGARCELCDEPADSDCARCQCHVCKLHAAGGAYCAMCLKEERDDSELARFASSVTAPESEADLFGRQRAAPLIERAIGWVGRGLFEKSAPAETPFAQRTPEEIRAWRRTAGIRIRT